MVNLPESITVNDITHATADLSEPARNQVINIQVVDAEITRLQQQIVIAQTARNAYISALVTLIEQPAAH